MTITEDQLATLTAEGVKLAVSYLRVSTKKQAEKDGDPEGYSIPAQREGSLRKAQQLGAVIVAEFIDKGESAKSADRPDLQRMLAYVKEHPGISYAIFNKVDRMARNRVDDVQITLALRQAGVSLVSANENIDETPSGMLLPGIMASIAEFYSRNLATETLKGINQKAKTGGTPTKAPIGYRNIRAINEDGKEVRTVDLDPDRATLVSWAFQAYACGNWTLRTLVDELEVRGLTMPPTPKYPARPVNVAQLQRVLTNPYFKGTVVWKGVQYEGRHPRLVDVETWKGLDDAGGTHRRRAATSAPALPQGLGLLRRLRLPARDHQRPQQSGHGLPVLHVPGTTQEAHHLHPQVAAHLGGGADGRGVLRRRPDRPRPAPGHRADTPGGTGRLPQGSRT